MVPLGKNNIKCDGAKELLSHNNSEHYHLSKKRAKADATSPSGL
jgi:hypothetical protein